MNEPHERKSILEYSPTQKEIRHTWTKDMLTTLFVIVAFCCIVIYPYPVIMLIHMDIRSDFGVVKRFSQDAMHMWWAEIGLLSLLASTFMWRYKFSHVLFAAIGLIMLVAYDAIYIIVYMVGCVIEPGIGALLFVPLLLSSIPFIFGIKFKYHQIWGRPSGS